MSESHRKQIAKRIQAARKQAGLTQGQLALLLKMKRPTISEIEAGRRKISAEELKFISEILGVSISWLTAGESEVPDPTIELAARELAKLKKEDLDAVINLLTTLRSSDSEH